MKVMNPKFSQSLLNCLSLLMFTGFMVSACGDASTSNTSLNANSLNGAWALTKIDESSVSLADTAIIEIKSQVGTDACNGNILATNVDDRLSYSGLNVMPEPGCFVSFPYSVEVTRSKVQQVLKESPAPTAEIHDGSLIVQGSSTRLEFQPQN